MAELTGLSQAFLSMLESGRRRLTNIDKIVEFLTGLGVPAELVSLPPSCPRSGSRAAGRRVRRRRRSDPAMDSRPYGGSTGYCGRR
ncbi:helix-turn-helix transcriptional regulator [Streptomyces diastatochromogenes]|nr:helix-turn-helix transcriptional regulator [Streptomyces diastatochromogenes]